MCERQEAGQGGVLDRLLEEGQEAEQRDVMDGVVEGGQETGQGGVMDGLLVQQCWRRGRRRSRGM